MSLRRVWDRVRGPRAALLAFVAYLVVSIPVALHRGRLRWFVVDEWVLLTSRELDSLHGLLDRHNDHWVTVPVIVFRLLYAVFGIRSYVPYQLVAIGSHLAVVVLVRVLMRRVGVSPWLATLTAAVLVLFGPGREDFLWAFQVSFTAAVGFGLAQLLVADHPGPLGWRDGAALALGLLAIMSAGPALAVVAATGVALLVRHGWRRAALQTVPLGVAYVASMALFPGTPAVDVGTPTADAMLRWVWSAATGTFGGIGHHGLFAALLAVVFVAGTALALRSGIGPTQVAGDVAPVLEPGGRAVRWRRLLDAARRGVRPLAAPLALVGAAVVFAVLTGWTRWIFGSGAARSSRYLYLYVALVLPALGVALQALVERWRRLGPVLAVGLVGAMVANASAASFSDGAFQEAVYRRQRELTTTVVRLPEARRVPSDVRPVPTLTGPVSPTMGFLLGAYDTGKLRATTGPIEPILRNELLVRLGVAQRPVTPAPRGCDLPLGVDGTAYPVGTRFLITGTGASAGLLDAQGVLVSPLVGFFTSAGNVLTIELPGLRLRLVPAPGSTVGRCPDR